MKILRAVSLARKILRDKCPILNCKEWKTTEDLIKQLRQHNNPLKRAEAAEKLQGDKDDSSYVALVAALDDPHLAVSEAAAKALGARGEPRAVEPLLEALQSAISQHDSFKVRNFAEALGQLADPRALPPLIESLRKMEGWFHSDISKVLAGFGETGIPLLIEALNHTNARVRAGVISALTMIAPRAVKPLIHTLQSGKPRARQGAAIALTGAPGSEAVHALIAATVDSRMAVAKAAIDSLGELHDPRALDALVSRLSNPNVPIRRAAIAALGKLEDQRAVDPLITTLADRQFRVEAEQSLVTLGTLAIEPLQPLLGDTRTDVSESAATVLGRIGGAALGALLENLRGPQWQQRKAAAAGLGRTCDLNNAWQTPLYPQELRTAASALQDALDDENSEVRAAAAEALGVLAGVARAGVKDGRGWYLMLELPDGDAEMPLIKEAAETSIRRLVDLLDDPAFRVRVAGAKALGRVRDPSAKQPLIDLLKRPSESARMAAAEALMHVQDGSDATAIVEALADPDATVRYAVAVAITRHIADQNRGPTWFSLMKDYAQVFIPTAVSDVVTALTKLAQEERNPQVQLAALQALETIREGIREKRKHGSPDIHYAAHELLESRLGMETEEETIARETADRAAKRSESDRFTDLTLYKNHLFPGDNSTHAIRVAEHEALQNGERYTLEVAIRKERRGIAAATSAPRPVLNPRQSTETLKIFVVARARGAIVIDEPVASVDWPHDADSSPAFFRLTVPDTLSDPEEATIEVCIYHANLDLLDVVSLTVFVTPADESANVLPARIDWPRSSKAEPRLDPDTAVRKLTIRIGPAVEGYKLSFIFLRGDQTISFPLERDLTPGDLEALLTKVRDFWTQLVITNYETQLKVSAPTWKRYLVRLSELGNEAWELLFGSRAGSQKGASETISDLLLEMDLAAATHVQVTYDRGVTDFVFPWSILYPPGPAGAAIEPFLFWGARYQVEQVWEGRSHDGLDAEPVGVAVVVDPSFGEVKAQIEMMEDFKSGAGGRLDIDSPISDRQGLLAAFSQSPSRHLYYFFCHGYAPAGPPILRRESVRLLRESIEALPPGERETWNILLDLTAKMGDEAWMFIGGAQVGESELRRARNYFNQRRPVVFLNMCHSAAIAPSVTRGLVRLFMERDASAVIGTEAPMTSVFAHAFAQELLKGVFEGKDLGTALWQARRHFLSDEFRNPLGFAYTLYGRATAKVGMKPLVSGEAG